MDSINNTSALNIASRVRRIVTGSALIGIAMSATGSLGYLALLPLLAIYPIITGLLGEDPIDGLLANWQGGFEGKCFRPSTRVALLAVGGVAIGVMMASPEHVGIRALLAIAAVYPVMAGLFGEDLLSLALGFSKATQQAVRPVPVIKTAPRRVPRTPIVKQRPAAAHHHWFGHGAGPKTA